MCLFDKDRRNFEDLYGFCVSSIKRQLNHQIVFCFTKKRATGKVHTPGFGKTKAAGCVFFYSVLFSPSGWFERETNLCQK